MWRLPWFASCDAVSQTLRRFWYDSPHPCKTPRGNLKPTGEALGLSMQLGRSGAGLLDAIHNRGRLYNM